ncbi:hypothetical protein ACNKHO_16800 [Shigella flexneri]
MGLGQMNLHGYLAREGIAYGSPEGWISPTSILTPSPACAAYLDEAGVRSVPVVRQALSSWRYASGREFQPVSGRRLAAENPK